VGNLIRLNKLLYLSLILAPVLFISCAGVDVRRITEGTIKAVRPLSEEEEYYVGRGVAARILSSYPLLEDKKLTRYVNLIGQTLALHSNKPSTYGGYHFAVLDSEEVNAFACPGGTILITKGMIHAVQNEDELAAVLAHEVAHINHRDGISAIQKARLTQLATLIGTETAKKYSSQQVAQLVGVFEGSIEDVFKTLVVNGYGQAQESRADESALAYLSEAGYKPEALKEFLERLLHKGQASGGGVLKTHPATADRIENIKQKMPSEKVDASLVRLRSGRFQWALKNNQENESEEGPDAKPESKSMPDTAGEKAPEATGEKAPETSPPEYIVHKVKSGETLLQIAKTFTGNSANWKQITDYNKIDPAKLKIGQEIKIPFSLLSEEAKKQLPPEP